MKKKSLSRVDRVRSLGVSRTALADFLTQLSSLYESRELGNPPLAEALRELAISVRRGEILKADKLPSRVKKTNQSDLELLSRLDPQAVERFISDETKTKDELLDLAAARFSMPRSQLKRMKTVDVRNAIRSALLHESSLEIISEEAKRGGAMRMS